MINDIQERLISAIKVKDKKYITVLRDIKSNLTEAEKVKKKPLTEQEQFDVLGSMAKKRKQSIESCGDNYKYQDLKAREEFELMVIEEYLPTKMTAEEIENAIAGIIKIEKIEHGMKNMGHVMKSFTEQYPNQDGKLVSKLVRKNLST